MRKLHIGTSPLTGTIFGGHVLKAGVWAKGKQDLTVEALSAVAEHALHFKDKTRQNVIISELDGSPLYEIEVRRLTL